MSSYVGIPSNNPAKYLGPDVSLESIVTRNREPTGADIRQGTTGTYYPIGSFWIISKNPTTGTEGDLWWLSKIVANVAFWVQISSGSGPATISIGIDANAPTGTNPVVPDGTGEIDINGATVIPGTNPVRTNSIAANSFQIQVQRSQAVAATDPTTVGLSNFRDTQFSVTTDGFVSLLGGTGPAVKSVNIQVIPTTGTYTPTANMQYCIIEVLGGGGGGGGNEATVPGNSYTVGAGGGSGEYARGIFSAASIGAGQAVTIGAGGAGNSGLAGSNGGTTSVGALITAFGGTGGATSGAATTTFLNAQSGIGGTGGTGGQLRTAGSIGTPGVIVIDGAGTGFLQGGAGGNSQYGAGGNYVFGAAVGNVGLGYGSGGGGSAASGGSGTSAGGAGAPGVVIVTEFIS